jgi:hypothetical protein
MNGGTIMTIDRRSSERFEISVELEGKKNGDVFLGTSVNVSESGILIQTNKALHLGEPVTIRLVSPGREDIVGVGTVVRSEDFGLGQTGYAVHWYLSSAQKAALQELIRKSRA